MADTSGYIEGELAEWPTKERMAEILRDAGLRVGVGRYSIRVEDCSRFEFKEYGSDLGCPCIEADADSAEEMLREGKLVSAALAGVRIRHRFEIYDDRPDMVGYLHYDWPLAGSE